MTPLDTFNKTPADAAGHLRRTAKQRSERDPAVVVVFEVDVPGGLRGQGWQCAYSQFSIGFKRRCILTVRTFPTDRVPNGKDAEWLVEFFAEMAVPDGSVALFAQAASAAPTAPHPLGWDEQMLGARG